MHQFQRRYNSSPRHGMLLCLSSLLNKYLHLLPTLSADSAIKIARISTTMAQRGFISQRSWLVTLVPDVTPSAWSFACLCVSLTILQNTQLLRLSGTCTVSVCQGTFHEVELDIGSRNKSQTGRIRRSGPLGEHSFVLRQTGLLCQLDLKDRDRVQETCRRTSAVVLRPANDPTIRTDKLATNYSIRS